MCLCVWLSVDMCKWVQVPAAARRGHQIPWGRVTGSCKSLHVGAGNQTQSSARVINTLNLCCLQPHYLQYWKEGIVSKNSRSPTFRLRWYLSECMTYHEMNTSPGNKGVSLSMHYWSPNTAQWLPLSHGTHMSYWGKASKILVSSQESAHCLALKVRQQGQNVEEAT